jgi:Rod binding domain-containing protein
MRESLSAACGQFEQVILAQMLRTAGIGTMRTIQTGDADDSGDRAGGEAYEQLFVQALASALERAGGIGLQRALRSAFAGKPS